MSPIVPWGYTLQMYIRGLGWAIIASLGFAVGIAVAIKIFDLFSTKIDEWEEIKKGNLGVALIIVALIISVAAIVIKVI